jgi:hypothetical protein
MNDFDAFSFFAPDGSSLADGGSASQEDATATNEAGYDPGAGVKETVGDAGVNAGGMDSGKGDSGGKPDSSPEAGGATAGNDAAGDSGQAGDSEAADTETDGSGGQQDARPFDEQACRYGLEPLVPSSRDACADCACSKSSCGYQVVSCLDSGNAAEDALCTAVLRCALQKACQVWDCYCIDPNCGAPSPDGQGPCVSEMNAAVDGHKREVMQVSKSSDQSEPLVRALQAVSCMIGSHRRSPGGASSGACETECLTDCDQNSDDGCEHDDSQEER